MCSLHTDGNTVLLLICKTVSDKREDWILPFCWKQMKQGVLSPCATRQTTNTSLNNHRAPPQPPAPALQTAATASAGGSRTRGGTGTRRRTGGPALRLTPSILAHGPSPAPPYARCWCMSPRSAARSPPASPPWPGSPRSGDDDAPGSLRLTPSHHTHPSSCRTVRTSWSCRSTSP